MKKRSLVAGLALIAFLVCLALFWMARRSFEPVPGSSSGEATVEFLDVGQGDSALITSPEGKTALIDAGPSSRVVDLLRDRGIIQLDLVVVSHHHADHYGGMKEVIRQFHPRMFLDADSPHVTKNYVALLRLVKEEGITSIRAGPTARKIELGSVTLTVFPQAPSYAKEENNNSICIRLQYGDFSALFPGDAEWAERRWWMENVPDLCAGVDVLKLAHHGSRNGTDADWLALTRPKLAVASLAAGNEFGHPHPETLKLLRSRAIPLQRTDQSGSIAIQIDGRTWSVKGVGKAVLAE
jgi:competence protein ComEC